MVTSPVLSGASGAIGDDHDPFLLPTTSASSGGASTSTTSPRERARMRQWLRTPVEFAHRVALTCAVCSVSGGVTWLVKGLFVCVGMMFMGGVGSFTLHQMMSPQIEALIQQRAQMQKELEALQLQMENMTHVAESRLETIHLLEQELEKQAVEAAAAFAVTQSGQDNGDGLRSGHRVAGGGFRGGSAFLLPTIFYAGVLGTIILVSVVYRVYRIVQAETQKHSRALRHHDHDGSASRAPSAASTPSSMSIGIADDDSAIGSSHNAVLSPNSSSDRNESSPQQCYKRTQLPSPTSRLMHVAVHWKSREHRPDCALVHNIEEKMARGAAVHPTSAQKPLKKSVAFAAATASRLLDEKKLTSVRSSEEANKVSESDENDSDYNFEEDTRESNPDEDVDGLLDDEKEDSAEFHRLLQAELDECADDGQDFYLKQILAERDGLEGEDAEFVERYILAQQEWKDRHKYSIDAFDLDVQLKPRSWTRAKPPTKPKLKKVSKKPLLKKKHRQVRRQPSTHDFDMLWRAWHDRVVPNLPLFLRDESPEYVVSVLGAVLFVVIALGVQVYYALRTPHGVASSN
ncbi:hypothetical protein FI667_g9533, partial [Globisporangium splendens]